MNRAENLYKIVWEIKQKVILDQAIARGSFIDQTQSTNLWFAEPTSGKLSGAHFYGWKNGLKTGMYYLRTKPKAQTQKFTIEPIFQKENKLIKTTDDMEREISEKDKRTAITFLGKNMTTCSNEEGCLMCSG